MRQLQLNDHRAQARSGTGQTKLYVASIAHELHQPLSAVILNAQAARRWLRGPSADLRKARERLRAIDRDVHRAADILARLRSLVTPIVARPTSPCDVNALLRESVTSLRAELRRQRVRLHLDLASELPPISGDALQLQEVFTNLIRNALDAMHDLRGRRLRELRISSQLDRHRRVLLKIRDSGVGLRPWVQRHLFEPFHTTKPDGMGVGLSLSRRIVLRHRGKLWAVRNAAHGITLNLALPASLVRRADDNRQPVCRVHRR